MQRHSPSLTPRKCNFRLYYSDASDSHQGFTYVNAVHTRGDILLQRHIMFTAKRFTGRLYTSTLNRMNYAHILVLFSLGASQHFIYDSNIVSTYSLQFLQLRHLNISSIYIQQVQCGAVKIRSIFSQVFTIARPLGRGVGCLLWVIHVIDILSHFLQLCI